MQLTMRNGVKYQELPESVQDEESFEDSYSVTSSSVKLEEEARGPRSSSHIATLKNEIKDLERAFLRTRQQLDKSNEQNFGLRKNMKTMRADKEKLQRSSDKLRKMVHRMQDEKRQIELQAVQNREYAKRIEQRYSTKSNGQSAANTGMDLSRQVEELSRMNQEHEESISEYRSTIDDLQKKNKVLRRALDTRFDEMELNGSLHNGILYEFAEVEDEKSNLALQLANEEAEKKKLQSSLEENEASLDSLQNRLEEKEAYIAGLEKERTHVSCQLSASARDIQNYAVEKTKLLHFIQEQAEVKLHLESKLVEKETEYERKIKDLVRRLDVSESNLHNLTRHSESQREYIERLEKDDQEFQKMLQDQAGEIQDLKEQNAAKENERIDLETTKKSLADDFAAVKAVCEDLKSQVQQLESSVDEGSKERFELQAQIDAKHRELLQKEGDEKALKEAMEKSLQDLQTISSQRNEAAKAMNEAVNLSACSLQEQKAMESRIEKQNEQINKLKDTKKKMETALLEQLSSLRKHLHDEKIKRMQAQSKLRKICEYQSTEGGNELAFKQACKEELDFDYNSLRPSPLSGSTRSDKLKVKDATNQSISHLESHTSKEVQAPVSFDVSNGVRRYQAWKAGYQQSINLPSPQCDPETLPKPEDQKFDLEDKYSAKVEVNETEGREAELTPIAHYDAQPHTTSKSIDAVNANESVSEDSANVAISLLELAQ